MNAIEKFYLKVSLVLTALLGSVKADIDIPDKAIGGVIDSIKDVVTAQKMEPYVQMGMYLIAGLIVAILLLVVVLIFKRNNKPKSKSK